MVPSHAIATAARLGAATTGRRRLEPINRALVRCGAGPLVQAHMRLGHAMRLDLRSPSEWYAFWSGAYDDGLIAGVRRLLRRPGATAVDAGANVGLWTVPLAARVRQLGGRVVAAEPFPRNAARLRDNLALNRLDGIVDVVEAALSDRPADVTIALHDDGTPTGNAAVALDDGADDGRPSVKARAVPLDDALDALGAPPVDLVKADVEGHEDRLLAGAARTLARSRPVVVAEWNRVYYERRGVDPAAAFAAALAGLDYRCLRRDGAGRWSQAREFASHRTIDDLVFTPAERTGEALDALGARTPSHRHRKDDPCP